MSAARILNPVVLSEFCKIRGAASSPAVSRNLPCGQQLQRIKRDLFGPANPVETNKIFTEELEKHQERAIKKWGFDFRAGSPLRVNSQFVWERISHQESSFAPEMYTLTRAAHVRPAAASASSMDLLMDERAERENLANLSASATDTDSCDDESHDEEQLVTFKVPSTLLTRGGSTTLTLRSASAAQMRKRQPKITEYMKERKRLAQTPKKVSPAKRMRPNSGISHSPNANSISSHFSLRSLQRNN